MPEDARSPILIVDDDADVRVALQQVLESAGYPTAPAADGREALSIARRWRPGLVLLDLMMPGMDGWDFLLARLSQPETASVPVIVISAVMTESRKLPREVDGYLPKPFGADELLAMVSGLYQQEREPPNR